LCPAHLSFAALGHEIGHVRYNTWHTAPAKYLEPITVGIYNVVTGTGMDPVAGVRVKQRLDALLKVFTQVRSDYPVPLVWSFMALHPSSWHLVNSLEDLRVDTGMGEDFPGWKKQYEKIIGMTITNFSDRVAEIKAACTIKEADLLEAVAPLLLVCGLVPDIRDALEMFDVPDNIVAFLRDERVVRVQNAVVDKAHKEYDEVFDDHVLCLKAAWDHQLIRFEGDDEAWEDQHPGEDSTCRENQRIDTPMGEEQASDVTGYYQDADTQGEALRGAQQRIAEENDAKVSEAQARVHEQVMKAAAALGVPADTPVDELVGALREQAKHGQASTLESIVNAAERTEARAEQAKKQVDTAIAQHERTKIREEKEKQSEGKPSGPSVNPEGLTGAAAEAAEQELRDASERATGDLTEWNASSGDVPVSEDALLHHAVGNATDMKQSGSTPDIGESGAGGGWGYFPSSQCEEGGTRVMFLFPATGDEIQGAVNDARKKQEARDA
jgi:hypothetical protein